MGFAFAHATLYVLYVRKPIMEHSSSPRVVPAHRQNPFMPISRNKKPKGAELNIGAGRISVEKK